MDKITCKHCGTKYPADVSKCPLCGASNAPSVGDEFDFLDDDFEAKPAETPAEPAAPVAPVVTPAAEEPEAPAAAEAETPADAILKDPAFTSGVPSSGNTARYNWEEIIAEINKQKEQKTDTAEAQPVAAVPAEEPAAEAEQPEAPEQPAERRTLRREREPKKSGSKGVIIALVAVIVVAALLLVLKSTGVLTSLFQKEEPVEEAPELPVEQDVDCTGISLSVNELAITGLGNTATLQATAEPENCTQKINWFSGDPAIATVDADGKVTAVAEGRVNIQATCGDYAATCMVTVTAEAAADPENDPEEEQEQEPTGTPELSATDITMTYPGEMARLYVNNIGDQEVTWSTDNSTLLSIDDTGLITALGTGTANVYAEVDGQKLECIVRLRLGGTEGEAITVSLNATDISMFYEGETFRLEVTYAQGEPEGVTHEWSSSDDSVCTVDATGMITAVGNGTAYISTTADGVNLKCIVRVTLS